ncbi:hypothetical protein [Marinigracilibium pacificum]|uniref:Uncharacterized protein n=1 Tax=Marinigracilibium pacificum TaxID=2729599 RepID=A0A848ISG8_9BACT|nr:hypothetical protein [Marinigracilibium pacificum]NMM47393.1 hypothetical protein [Marinigracilibium pacificum]
MTVLTEIEHMHKEHQVWLGDIAFWEEELRFLTSLCEMISGSGRNGDVAKLLNELAHHKRMIKSLKDKIVSHETFFHQMMEDEISAEEIEHDEHIKMRVHIKNFKDTYRKLKKNIFLQKKNIADMTSSV